MPKSKHNLDPINEISELFKKALILKLFEMNVSQGEIAKKLHMNLNTVNGFLKGVKKN